MTASVFEVHNPADGRVVATVAAAQKETVDAAVAELRAAQPGWEALGPKGRVRWLRRYANWLLDNERSLGEVLQQETSKPWAEATIEVPYVVDLINYYCARAEEFLSESSPRPHGVLTVTKKQLLLYRPYPVVGVITPWNFPLALALIDAIPALLAGASVLVKPSEFTPLATRAAIDGWAEIGAPEVFACVTGAAATGSAVVDSVDYVQFTGSTRTGRVIATRAAERLIPFSLELGGKDAMIVLADADLDRAAAGAVWGSMVNAGQMCTSVERVYVEAAVYDEFVARVVDRVRVLRVGSDDQSYRADVGALATDTQVEIVARHVEDACNRGAKALTGGARAGSGNFFEPTVLVGVDHSMSCMTEETFGPTIPIMKVTNAEEALRLANDSRYGLSATVWSRDTVKAESLARRLNVGAVNINDIVANLFTLALPQAGWQESGIGARLGGAAGVRKFCRTQAIVTARVALSSEPTWYPYTRGRGALLRRVARLFGARDLRRRFVSS